MEEKIFQKFILGTGDYLESALSLGLGGVIFFSKDITEENQFKNLILDIKDKSIIPPFLSIDQEGGRVERTENIYPRRLSQREAYKKGEKYLIEQTEQMAKELKNFGINLNFSPCADVNTNPNNPIIGNRAFSDKTKEVIKGVHTVCKIYKSNNIIPCVKHYPGHGDADKDSHLTLPQINLPLQEMEQIHIAPFKFAVENGIDMIMAAHLHCTCFDKDTIPSSLSKNAIGYLRHKLNFNGVIITDDMVMKGVEQFGSLKAILMAIEAGVDMFIFRKADKNTVDTIKELCKIASENNNIRTKIEESNQRIIKLKKKYEIIV